MARSAVVVLNGFLGNRRKKLDVGDLVRQYLKEVEISDRPSLYVGRGGAGIAKFNELRRHVHRQSGAEKLVLIGKSYGAHWLVRLLWKLAGDDMLHRFGQVRLVTVDPSYVLHSVNRKTKSIPEIYKAANYFQYGRRGGYRLGPPAENIVVKCAKHTNIEDNPEVQKGIKSAIVWAVC